MLLLTTKVIVRKDGKPWIGASVRLSFHVMAEGSVTSPVQTNEYGAAIIRHRLEGTADILVNGRRCGHYLLPAEVIVEL